MHDSPRPNRRTALKTIGTAVLGGLVATGPATARRCMRGEAAGRPGTVEIVAQHDHDTEEHGFVLGTAEVPAGWTTLTLVNRTPHTHFAYLQKIPEAAIAEAAACDVDLLDYWVEQVTDPFQVFMDYLLGDAPEPPTFPSWFGDIEPRGGPGMTSGGETATTTVHLDAGQYQVECYVKDERNVFHSTRGMVGLLTVTDDRSSAPEPRSTLDLSLSTADGLTAPTAVRPGRHTVAVRFEDQQAYEHLLGHDVHLIRYDGDTDREDVNGWMDWTNALGTSGNQLVSDGSDPGRFVGGVQDIWTADLPRTGYVHVLLQPGEYAWVAEVPDPASRGLLTEFSVPARSRSDGRQRGGTDSAPFRQRA